MDLLKECSIPQKLPFWMQYPGNESLGRFPCENRSLLKSTLHFWNNLSPYYKLWRAGRKFHGLREIGPDPTVLQRSGEASGVSGEEQDTPFWANFHTPFTQRAIQAVDK
ncbi:hypothetical protein AVEN_178877-1 [Araneus ventricosus]|uniref:Uncharacterized protein n=1 Tax=Araneus ventricosus TaxID=182803 RepID=A0A4Y2UN07_ARAVE|nr:hypothetical protein AVEN_169493-1 [Araneus ventricosus]GBO13113.1 hypothetical protein AVEN_178877-1 [Araneus ventricosus]